MPIKRFLLLSICLVFTTALLLHQTDAPARSPDSVARIELGRRLFYDVRLSGNGRIACAACHQQALGFSDGNAVSRGANGDPLRRNTPGLFNLAEIRHFTWADASGVTLEQQIAHPLFAAHPPEMGAAGPEGAILDRLRADPAYQRQFSSAFPDAADPFGWTQITTALAAFVRSLTAFDTPYDRFVYNGDRAALSPTAQRGMALFFSPGLACGHCHVDIAPPGADTPLRRTDFAFVSTGAGISPDRGLAEQSGNPADAYRFRVPPLRNVAVTAPYMHDGSLATLNDVIRFYESGGRDGAGTEPERIAARHPLIAGFALSDAERRDLIAFLESLSDTGALQDPRFGDPVRTTE